MVGAGLASYKMDSRMLSTTVASQCQTLRKLLAGDRE